VVDLIEEAWRLQEFLESHSCRFCIIGGIAVQCWGEPRLTRDIDLSRSAATSFFCVVRAASASTYLSRPYEELVIQRASRVEFLPDRGLLVCSAEDLVIMKLFAGRETDLRDARSVLVRQSRLDWSYMEAHLLDLAAIVENPDLLRRLHELRRSVH
jgi:hypothetical protein